MTGDASPSLPTAAAPLAGLAARYAFNLKTAHVIAEAFEPADWAARPPGGGNCAHWILGHLAMARRGVCRLLGAGPAPEPWEEPFRRDARPASDEAARYPSPRALLEDLASSGERIGEALGRAGADQLNGPAGRSFPDGSDTVGGAVQFLHFHESYHLGQLGLLRRLAGKPGFI